MLAQKLLEAAGNATQPNYIEDVFSTYLIKPSADFTNYSINNGIDLSTKGGMTWFKARDAAQNNLVYDTARGSSSGNANALITNGTQAQQTTFFDYVTPNTNGFTVNYASGGGQLTNSGINYASWTFRKQPKFFDVVTYTGNGTGQAISHNLGSTPGFIVVKRTDSTGDWAVYHRSLGTSGYTFLNLTQQTYYASSFWSTTAPTSTTFNVSTNSSVNASGGTYVAYLFAHNAGGFGLTGTDNVISCGSFTTDATTGNATVNLGFEPQWILTKMADGLSDWTVYDNMREMSLTNSYELFPNSSGSEVNYGSPDIFPSSTGFSISYVSGSGQYGKNKNIIYIAIRRGPMKVPTDATKVFSPVAQAGGGTVTTNFPVDLSINRNRGATGANWMDRLRGGSTTSYNYLLSTSTAAESTGSGAGLGFDNNTGYVDNGWWSSGQSVIYENFRRAPSFFDEVCYTGTGATNKTKTHNLGVVPELMIIKNRGPAGYTQKWVVYPGPLGTDQYMFLNTTDAAGTFGAYWDNTPPTSTTFSVGNYQDTNASTLTYVAYLFATCAGVSKVGSYTGNGSTQTINCGFAGGARFVLIKRTDSTGDWYVYDTARGIVTANDPHLSLNTTAAEVTTDDTIDPDSTGFIVNQVTATNVNVSSATYIYLAIA